MVRHIPQSPKDTIETGRFYSEYHGHRVELLQQLRDALVATHNDRGGGGGSSGSGGGDGAGGDGDRPAFVYLAGDSSLDNKYWLDGDDVRDAVNGYERVLWPAKCKPDIAYWLNVQFARMAGGNGGDGDGSDVSVRAPVAINCAVEESTLGARNGGRTLLPQDEFIRDNIGPDDVLVVSVGGNDIALKPTLATAWNMLKLTRLSRQASVEAGNAWGMAYFEHMFTVDIASYIEALVAKTAPKRVIVCMIYFPDETATGSWADAALGVMGYNTNPAKLQAGIRRIYEQASTKVRVVGGGGDLVDGGGTGRREVEVVPFAMYSVLDGTNTADYVARVEPSATGGEKIAAALAPLVRR